MKYFITRKACPACESNNQIQLIEYNYSSHNIVEYLNNSYLPGNVEFEYLKGARYTLRECKDCGLIFQKFAPNEILSNRIYNNWINADNAFKRYEYINQDHKLIYDQMIKIMDIIAYFGFKRKINVFDFGYGFAHQAIRYKQFGCKVYGCEIEKKRILNFENHGLVNLAYNEIINHKYDYMRSFAVFEHLLYPANTLKYITQSLNPGGIIEIYVPNGFDIKRRLSKSNWGALKGDQDSVNSIAPLEHLNCFNFSSLKNMAEKAGLKLINIKQRHNINLYKIIRSKYQIAHRNFSKRKSTTLTFVKPK